jgi:hypothetical protein
MPGSRVGNGELIRRGDFSEPSIHAKSIFLQAVFCHAGALADSLNAVYFVQDSLGYQSEVSEVVEEQCRTGLAVCHPGWAALELGGCFEEGWAELSFAEGSVL